MINSGKVRFPLLPIRGLFAIKDDWNIISIDIVPSPDGKQDLLVTFTGPEFPQVDNENGGVPQEVTINRVIQQTENWDIQKV